MDKFGADMDQTGDVIRHEDETAEPAKRDRGAKAQVSKFAEERLSGKSKEQPQDRR